MQAIPKVVITGGPCAGKTTMLAKASAWCSDRGYQPLIVPEAATIYITGGLNPRHPAFQEAVISHVLHMERVFEEVARETFERPLLICDRGIFDQKAYMDDASFHALCLAHGLRAEEELVRRYAGVIFLQSAANGAEEFYSSASNTARYEGLEEARVLNARTHDAWMGVPHLSLVENRKGQSFEDKLEHGLKSLARILGEPEPLEVERKFLVKDFDPASLPSHAVPVDIVQHYLVPRGMGVERVRARGQNNVWTYIHTTKQKKGPGVNVEKERILTEREYQGLLVRRDGSLKPIHKTRHCFSFDGQYCELDVFEGHRSGLVMLEIETSEEDRDVRLPPFLSIEREVTGNFEYSNYSLADAA